MPAISRRAGVSGQPFPARCRNALRSPWQRVLERQAVEQPPVGAHQREGVEDADRARMAVEQLAEVGLAQPPVDARADLDADDRRDHWRAAEPPGEIDLAEPAFAEQPLDAVFKLGFGTRDQIAGLEEIPRAAPRTAKLRRRASRR